MLGSCGGWVLPLVDLSDWWIVMHKSMGSVWRVFKQERILARDVAHSSLVKGMLSL